MKRPTADRSAKAAPHDWLTIAALMLAVGLAMAPAAAPAGPQTGQLLRDALLELNERGAGLFFSSEIVVSQMRVTRTPASSDPLQIAREILAPHGLTLTAGPGGRWLVTRDDRARSPASVRITGRIVDAATNLPIIAADIVHGTVTTGVDPDGRFALQLRLPAELVVRAAGYESKTVTVGEGASLQLNVGLARPRQLEVLVVASRYRIYGDEETAEFDHDEIDRLPHLADDPMRAISRLPATAADDFSAQINLRGGTREETAVYLDGLELIDPFHLKDLQGALSIVDSNLVDRVDVLPGGFPAIHGDRASGIVDIHTLSVPEQNVHSLGVSFVNAFANTRGRFNDGQGGWLLSVRRGYLDWLFRLIDTGEGEFTPRYLDVLAKIEHDVGERHTVSGHVLAAEDDLTYEDDSEGTLVAGNADSMFLWTRMASRWTDAITSDTVLWRSAVDRTRDIRIDNPDEMTANVLDRRDLSVHGVRSDWRWGLNGGWSIGFGLDLARHRVDYDYRLTAVTTAAEFPGQPPIDRGSIMRVDGETLGLYGSLRKDFGRLAAELGWRHDAEGYTGLDDTASSPRLNLRYDLTRETKLFLAWGDYHQFQPAEALQVEDGVEQFGPATHAEHRMVGFEHRFGSDVTLRADAYQKRYRRLRPRYANLFDGYEPIPEANPDRVRIAADSAEALGLEIALKRRATESFSWWASYTYSSVEDSIDGNRVPREWDQPHALNLVLNWQGERWNFNAATAWRRGWPRTNARLAVVETPAGPQPGIVPGERNTDRYADYWRVDCRISRDVVLERGKFTYFFEIYNLFDNDNPCCIDEVSLLPGPALDVDEENWLPRMPSFGFAWTFH